VPIFRIISKYKDIYGETINGGGLVKYLFLLLSLLNMLDALFTYIGLKYTLILESNPLMNSLWMASPFFFLFCKISLSLLLVVLAFFFTTKNRKIWYGILLLPFGVYCFTMMIHLYWMFSFIYLS